MARMPINLTIKSWGSISSPGLLSGLDAVAAVTHPTVGYGGFYLQDKARLLLPPLPIIGRWTCGQVDRLVEDLLEPLLCERGAFHVPGLMTCGAVLDSTELL